MSKTYTDDLCRVLKVVAKVSISISPGVAVLSNQFSNFKYSKKLHYFSTNYLIIYSFWNS